ncbi:hypothetical protein [Pseudomonas frederiksbergensis]|uniref:hypothetical protein n=1 Tax=Pseudomonas frederiksbergensis TaxID=104087 RepID=UPI003D1ABB12
MSIVLLQSIESNGLQVELATDKRGHAYALELRYGEAVRASFNLASAFQVPKELLTPDLEPHRLKTLPEIRAEVASAASDALQSLEDRWRQLVNSLSTAQIVLDADGKLLGAVLFPDGTQVAGLASFNLGACLSRSGGYADFQGSIAVTGNYSAEVNGVQVMVQMGWRIDVAAAAEFPRLSLEMPSFGLHVPPIDFPAFDWSAWKPGSIQPGFRLPTLPGLPFNATAGDATLQVIYDLASNRLDARLEVPAVKLSAFGSDPVNLGDLIVTLQNDTLKVEAFKDAIATIKGKGDESISLPPPLEHITLTLHNGSSLQLALDRVDDTFAWVGYVDMTVSIHATAQPAKRLKLQLKLPLRNGRFVQDVKIGEQTHTRKIDLIEPTLDDLAGVLIEHLPSLDGIGFSFRMPGTTLPSTDGLVEVLAAILGAIGRGAAGLARVIQSVLETLFRLLRSAAQALGHLEVLFVLDANSGRLQQLMLQLRHTDASGHFVEEAAGFELRAPKSADLALLIDLRNGARDAYAVVTVDGTAPGLKELLSIGTDLWFGTSQSERPTGETSLDGGPPVKLIGVTFEGRSAGRVSLVPIGVRNGQATFLQALAKPLPAIDRAVLEFDGYELVPVQDQATVTMKFPDAAAIKQRLLPFLASPKETTSAGADWLKQYIEIKQIGDEKPLKLKNGRFETDLKVMLHVLGSHIDSDIRLVLDARKMMASIQGGRIHITAHEELKLFGMLVSFKDSNGKMAKGEFVLDLGGADPRMYLAEGLSASLVFTALGTDTQGRSLSFRIDSFVVHGGGLDLDAQLAERFTLQLPGLETDFTFDQAAIKVRSGRAESFRLKSTGKLPPQLLGNVDVSLELDFGEMPSGEVGLIDGRLDLVSKGNIIRSDLTHFEFRLESLGLRVFNAEGGLHFCAFLTGSALFKPSVAELADGMLKKLANVELRFTDCPICGPSDVIRRELEKLNLSFVVALDEPMRATLFEMFFFEVRSIGFEPRSNMFDDRPFALVIGGQVRFAARGDVVRAECDFHKLYIAPGIESIIPRIRCEGLGLALRLGSALEIEGKVVAVDGRMPANVLLSRKPDDSLVANGFMGQGRVAVQGLPPIAASFGFVEVRRPEWDGSRKAWFVYLEAQRLSYHFQLGPIPFYLREAGLGMGYLFTYVGIQEIDEAPDLSSVIKKLDKIAISGLEPAKLDTWTLSGQDDITLVARAMFSMSSASTPMETLVWKEEEEKLLPNLLLLNTVLAMRKSTFMMTANGWLGYSYYDWNKSRRIGANELAGKQALTGYIVLAGARSEFLARLVSNPGVEIGPRLALPQQFKDALKDVQYDATLYMRPGLLHFELGWPNRIRWSKNIAGVNVTVAGGAIFRVHDGALLAGLNLEGQLSFEMSGSLDAGVVGISVQASVYAALTARIIGYLDSRSASNSLYYSLFSLQVCVRFQVSAWLEINAWLCKITIRASFSFSLQIDVVSELAIQGDGRVGARMRATIAVSVFGRSLGLSIGLAMSPGLVDSAAARVGRFMNLGLIQDTPSSVAPIGKQDEANQQAAQIGAARREARQQAATANHDQSDLAKVPQEEKVPAGFEKAPEGEGNNIGPTDFQAVLSYPKVKPAGTALEAIDTVGWVYMTFLPLESGEAKGGSSFYASPRTPGGHSDQHDHEILFLNLSPELVGGHCFVFRDNAWHKVELDVSGSVSIPTSVNWKVELPYTQSNENSSDGTPMDRHGMADLTGLFFAAFRTKAATPGEVNADKPYKEPDAKPEAQTAHTVSTSEQEQYNRQELGYLAAIRREPADRRCHEARDFLLHKFASDLFELADEGVVPDKTVHAAHLGLTLLVPRALADALHSDKPMEVKIRKRVDRPGLALPKYEESNPCAIFNPPSLRFSVQRPRFIGTGITIENGAAKLRWVLRWDAAKAAEDFVKHYRIVRTVTLGNDDHTSAPITVTCALEEQYSKDAKGNPVRYLYASSTRFTDEFEDLPPSMKKAMFRPDSGAVVRYAVTPVCVSDTDGVVCSDFVAMPSGDYHLPRLQEATATLEVDPAEDKKNPDKVVRFDLDIDLKADLNDVDGDQKVPPGMSLWWRVVARGESILPAGQYGSDAQCRRSLVSTIGAGLTVRPGDEVFDVAFGNQPVWTYKRKVMKPAKGDALDRLDALIQKVDDAYAWTLFAQVVLKKEVSSKKFVDVQCSRLVVLKLAVRVNGVVTQVPALECVRLPFASDIAAGVMAPVAREDLMVLPGRASLPEPPHKPTEVLAANLNVHPEFGAVSSLFWNLRPSASTGDVARRFRLRSGFDIYSLSLDTGLDPNRTESWLAAKRKSEVRLLGDDRAMLVPGEVGEPSNWKMRYPSHAARRTSDGSWYSEENAYIEWPAFPIRRHPLPEPASELIKALLGRGQPDFIALSMNHPIHKKDVWEFSLVNPPSGWTVEDGKLTGGTGDAVGVRAVLRSLIAIANGGDGSDWPREKRAGWMLEMQPMWRNGASEVADQDPEHVAMDFERDLHPALECILTHMRRGKRDDNGWDVDILFDVDRRPPPVVKAENLDEFLSVTGDAADPHGWAALDRLGLGVTVRLFDSFGNRFLLPGELRDQVLQGVEVARRTYQKFNAHLLVEYLLQPGAMTQRVPFEQMPDDSGAFPLAELDQRFEAQSLAMVRLSVRPAVHPVQTSPDADLGWPAFRRAFCLAMNLPAETEAEKNQDSLTLWRRWNRRFFEFAADPRQDSTQFAFGAVEQTEPVLAATDAIGRISVSLPEADGYAHRRVFAVVPQWRYANLLRDCGIAMPADWFPDLSRDEQRTLPAPARNSIAVGINNAQPSRAIVSIERTAPVLPQTAYSLGRLGDTEWWGRNGYYVPAPNDETIKEQLRKDGYARAGSIPGKDIAFVLPQHPEQILDEDNAPLARSLSHFGLIWQLGLHTVDPSWSGEYTASHTPPLLSDTDTQDTTALIELLAAREGAGDAVAQSGVKVMRHLPHWYRHTVHASASAGTATTEATAIYLPDAYASLVTIDANGKASLKPNHPWKNFKPTAASTEGQAQCARYVVQVPALRYRDTTDEKTEELWDDAISTLLDPQVAYDLEFRCEGTELRPQRSVRPLARLLRSGEAVPGQPVLRVMTISKDWDVQCRLEDFNGIRMLTIDISPLSMPVTLTSSLKEVLKTQPHIAGDQLRVAGGWSAEWLGELVASFGKGRISLGLELWTALMQAGVGLPPSVELKAFPLFEIRQLTLTRPTSNNDKQQLAQVIEAWLGTMENADPPLATALRSVLDPVLKQEWLSTGDVHTLLLPWIVGLPEPGQPALMEAAPDSSPRHLVPELMTQAQHEIAKQAAGGAAALDALWGTQKQRAWDGGELVIRATRGDAIALELAPVALK